MKKMKNLYYLIGVILTIGFTSCEDENYGVEVNNFNGNVAYFISGKKDNYFVSPNADAFKIQVGATNKSNSDRNYTIEVSPESTATKGVDFSVASSTVTIPAGEYFGEISIVGIYEGTTTTGSELILSLKGDSSDPAMINNSFSLSIFQKCISDLAGNYSVTTTYGFHDFLPDFNPYTMEMEIVAVDQEAGLYQISDFSGGLYSIGPYSTSYETDSESFTVQFTENCGKISWKNQSDAFGPCIPTERGINSVDFSSGKITISWTCEKYGENGVSVYTPI
ncbi:MAG: hypothetical protein P8L21_06345 [Polaribacter sp.]|jgi:hypothetical protein|nr:hypothetical protein [Polaribacter sp.]